MTPQLSHKAQQRLSQQTHVAQQRLSQRVLKGDLPISWEEAQSVAVSAQAAPEGSRAAALLQQDF